MKMNQVGYITNPTMTQEGWRKKISSIFKSHYSISPSISSDTFVQSSVTSITLLKCELRESFAELKIKRRGGHPITSFLTIVYVLTAAVYSQPRRLKDRSVDLEDFGSRPEPVSLGKYGARGQVARLIFFFCRSHFCLRAFAIRARDTLCAFNWNRGPRPAWFIHGRARECNYDMARERPGRCNLRAIQILDDCLESALGKWLRELRRDLTICQCTALFRAGLGFLWRGGRAESKGNVGWTVNSGLWIGKVMGFIGRLMTQSWRFWFMHDWTVDCRILKL